MRARAVAATLLCAALGGCGSSAHSPPRPPTPRPVAQPIVGSPAFHQVSSEALAGHPTHVPPAAGGCPKRPREHLLRSPLWLTNVEITEYFPTPESWFSGVRVRVPGLAGTHRVDWLYSSAGIAMEGEGVGLDGRYYGIASSGSGSWVTAAGEPTSPSACASRWSAGTPLWYAGGWRNARGAVTFPLERGGWSNGRGVRRLGYPGVRFVQRGSPSIRPYYSVAVDPRLIPKGSRIYIPGYVRVNGGWFVAADTGGGIIGRHIDVYRPPTTSINDGGRFLTAQRVYVVPPATR